MESITVNPFLELRDINDLTEYLKIPPKAMYDVLSDSQSSYRTFEIPKKKGGTRLIEAPVGSLKKVQRLLNYHLQLVYQHCRPECAHGFISNFKKAHATRNIVTNAKAHVGANHVLNIDLGNFFHSVDIWKVKEVFMSYPFYYGNDLASYIAILTTYNDRLPMGAPTSPVVANFASFMLDRKLMRFAENNNIVYTRYADDLTFSTKQEIKATHLQDIMEIIRSEKFLLNDKKTRLSRKSSCQTVTGLKVNEKVNVDRRFVRSIRGMLHTWQKYGRARAAMRNTSEQQFVNIVKGKLDFLAMVRGTKDELYEKLRMRYDYLIQYGY
ncbi:MAG: RNA-directed DNA polymerase [Chitinophagales bacterium]|nr:RNA-directed DNA polymerase [Chitinophagales bacterium]